MKSRVPLVVTVLLVLALGVGGALWWTQREGSRDAAARSHRRSRQPEVRSSSGFADNVPAFLRNPVKRPVKVASE